MTFPHHIIGLLKKSSGWTLCPEYEAVYNAYITKPSDPDAEVDNAMVLGWVNDGVWVKKDGIWVLANHVAGADSLRNWKSPSSTATAYNAPAWTQWAGYQGNGSNAYIDLNWNPAVNGVNYTLNSASVGVYVRNNLSAANAFDSGVLTAVGDILLSVHRYSSPDRAFMRMNSDSDDTPNFSGDERGMWIINRDQSTSYDPYFNKSNLGEISRNSTGLPNGNIYVFAYNNGGVAGGFGSHQLSVIFTGSGLTQTDIDNITDRFETRMDFHGTGVIP
ncbi:MAG TPA: hypothetical protein VMW53_11365 [archaeon]|nr:hypothetical protein [archaeon]